MYKTILDENGQRLNGIRREKLRRKKDMERLMGFRLLDDDFLAACCCGDTVCAELVLRIILEKPDLQVKDISIHVSPGIVQRPVRLDIRAEDKKGEKLYARIYCPVSEPDGKTVRQYSSMMDAYLMEENRNPDSLPETWLVFLMENDMMGKGLPVYRIERCCPETGGAFPDGSHILFVNGAFRGDDTPTGRLIHDLSCTDAADMYNDTLAERVRYFKETREGTEAMCRVLEKMRDQTYKDAKKKTAFRMFEAGKYTLEEIAGISGLTLEEVIRLKTGQDAD